MTRMALDAPRGFSLAATAGHLRAFAPAGHPDRRSDRLVLLETPQPGAGAPDVLPAAELRLRRAVRLAYNLPREPDDAELRSRAERWRPFRAWVAVLLRAGSGR